MVSHQLAIAKASLAAACIRPDPTPVPRDQVNVFHELLDAVLDRCSPENVQRCKEWLVENVLQSPAKVAAIGKYLVAVSASSNDEPKDASRRTNPRRTQIHTLYLINDFLHGVKFHGSSIEAFEGLSQSLSQHLKDMVTLAASHESEKYPQHFVKLDQLLRLWELRQYFSITFVEELRHSLDSSDANQVSSAAQIPPLDGHNPSNDLKKEVPFEMPATHGDPLAAYHELPAATMLPHIVPNRKTPIDPRQMTAMHFKAGAADKNLVSAVKNFLRDADIIYGLPVQEKPDVSVQLDEIGQLVYHDKITGEVVDGENYYGWSKQFCERMKRPLSQGSSRSRSRSRSPRRPSRRYSLSTDRSRSRSYSPSSPHRKGQGRRSRSRSSYGSRSPSRSRSQNAHRKRRPRSNSPAPAPYNNYQPPRAGAHPLPPSAVFPAQHQPPSMGGPYPTPLQFPFPGGIPLGPDGLPLPPPRPANWIGPWPPVPPPGGNGAPSRFSGPPGSFHRPPPGL